ncbi:hypothetical protein E5358_00595 [Palleniella muris]|uniref:Uncharacterized protein n=1 Tax=Palleniella muris TaxID=3038145 RepID=A0AC61QVH9_9BACT|nr:hypothetical protein [Palleniella muris]TGX84168.1 hypothetical protein E5358_00595 [Palleniella muris]
MKRIDYTIISLVAITAVILSCCGNTKSETSDNPEEQSLPMLGSWRYASMTYIFEGDKPDTASTVFGPDTIQIYDVYRHDSILESYVTLGDTILRRTQMRYIFRNDSIIAENEVKKVQVHVANATDSTLNFDFTLVDGDKTAICHTLSERCELPEWLKHKIKR